MRTPRVLFLGTRCGASAEALAPLATAGFDIRIVVPGSPGQPTGSRGQVPDQDSGDPLSAMAARAGFPVSVTPSIRDADRWAALVGSGIDLLVTACFPWRVPSGLVEMATYGGVNVHPSLLPVGRGPAPVFWTIRRGERRTGVTIHALTHVFDAGPILARAEVPTPTDPPLPLDELERSLFRLGGEMLPGVLRDLVAGTARPEPQDDAEATDSPVPGPGDYLIPTTLPAAWAYRFTRSVRGSGPTKVLIGTTGEVVSVADAVGFDPAGSGTPPVVWRDATVTVRFLDGTVTFTLDGPREPCSGLDGATIAS